MIRIPRRGRYTGRLAFDPDSLFHTEMVRRFVRVVETTKKGKPTLRWRRRHVPGRRVLTEDHGKTWRYARRGDASHFARYHQGFAVVDGTANAENPGSHHFNVLPNDPHADGLVFHPDAIAPTTTSHTEAYA